MAHQLGTRSDTYSSFLWDASQNTIQPCMAVPWGRAWHRQLLALRGMVRRRTLRDPVFIGVTGSCGKTTATHLIHSILASVGSCHTCIGNNRPQGWHALSSHFLDSLGSVFKNSLAKHRDDR